MTTAARAAFPESDRDELEMLATLYAADDALVAMRTAMQTDMRAGATQTAIRPATQTDATRGINAGQEEADSAHAASLRRIVAVGEVPDSWVQVTPTADSQPPTCMELLRSVPWNKIESIHVDEPGSEALVQQAIRGDAAAFEATGDVELLWYDVTEREALARELLHSPVESSR